MEIFIPNEIFNEIEDKCKKLEKAVEFYVNYAVYFLKGFDF